MKTSLLSFFCLLFVLGCKKANIDPEPIAPTFKTNCQLAKKQSFYQDAKGILQLQTEETYRYDSLKRIVEYKLSFDGNYTTRYEISFTDTYRYDANGFLIEKIRNGTAYNGFAELQFNKPSLIGIISGKTTFTYQNGLLIKEEAYRKVDAQYVIEFANPRTDRKLYEYDTQGKLSKYRNEDSDLEWISYFFDEGKITKSETDFYDEYAKKVIVANEFNQWGLMTQGNYPKKYYTKGNVSKVTNEPGEYDRFVYDGYGRRAKIEEYRQQYSSPNGVPQWTDDSKLSSMFDYQYEDTPQPETTLPLPKGHPRIPDFDGSSTYNIANTFIRFFARNSETKRFYSYTYNNEKLPVNVAITSNIYNEKGEISSTNKSLIKYEYVNCK